MAPHLFGVVPPYPVFLAAAVAVGFSIASRGLAAAGVSRPSVVRLLVLGVLAGLAGAKLYSAAERGGVVWWDPSWEIGNGYRYPGGIAAMAAALAIDARQRGAIGLFPLLGDTLAAAIAGAMCVARVGCLVAGCCHGIPATGFLAIRFPAGSEPWRAHLARGWIGPDAASSLPVHPLQVYFLIGSLLTLVAVLRFHRHRRYDGQTFLLFLTLDGLIKFVLEAFRLEARPTLQIAALAFAVAGVLGLLWNRGRRREADFPSQRRENEDVNLRVEVPGPAS